MQALWVPHVVAVRRHINVAMDWTGFHDDAQSTLMLSLIVPRGRAIPLLWQSVNNSDLRDQRGFLEEQLLVRLAEVLPARIGVCIVAERGFASTRLYRALTQDLQFDYVVRFRGDSRVTSAEGESRRAVDWIAADGKACLLRHADVTAERFEMGSVVCVRDPDMKQPWCL